MIDSARGPWPGRRLSDRVAIVTGASSGIGRATCIALAEAGAHIVAVGRDSVRLQATAAAVAAVADPAAETMILPLDVRSEADMQAMAERTLARFGRIDILVHSAGILRAQGATLRTLASLPSADWDEVLDINLRGTFLANRAVLPAMLAARSGDILNLSSKSGRAGIAFDAPYCASKFGVIGLSEAVADEVRHYGVRVQVLAPGRFDTEVLQQTGPLPHPAGIPPPQRVAEAIRWMLSMPADTRLLVPVIDPVESHGEAGWGGGKTFGIPSAHPASASFKEKTMNNGINGRAQDLRGKVVIVTGGTGGIGLATAQAVAGLGGSVVVADINAERVASVAAELEQTGANGALGLAIDVRREEDHQRLVLSLIHI